MDKCKIWQEFRLRKVDIEENDFFKKVRRIKILDEILLAWGRDKLILKDLDEPQKHFTFKVGKNGTLDFHETIEGLEKKYPRRGKILVENMKEFAYELRKTLIENLPKNLEEINLDDIKYRDSRVLIIPDRNSSRELFLQTLKRKGKKGLIDESGMMDLLQKFGNVPIRDLRDRKDFKFGCLLEDEKSPESFLYQIDGRYFILKVSNLMNLGEKLTEKYLSLQRNDRKKTY